MTDRPIRLAVLTPSLTGQVHIEHGEAIADLRVQCLKRGIAFRRFYNKGSSVLCKNRNVLAQCAVDFGADWVLWVDDDIAFKAEDVFRLMDRGKDIIGACPQRRTHKWGEGGTVAFDGVPKRGPDGLVAADKMPTAFLLVRGSVFTDLAASGLAPEYKTRDGASGELTMRKWFWFDVDAEGYDVGEDYYFCNQARKLDYECWCEPDVRLSHFEGLVEHTLSLADIMQAMEMADGNAS
jgi:hypothetical protein